MFRCRSCRSLYFFNKWFLSKAHK